MSLPALIPAIRTKAEAVTALLPLGSLYFNQVPEARSLPWWVFTIPTQVNPVRAFGARYFDETRVQFSIYHTSLETAKTMQAALHTAFDNTGLSLSSGVAIECVRALSFFRKEVGEVDKSGQPIYCAVSDYRIKVDQAW